LSTIVSPYPPVHREHPWEPPEGAMWWRFYLVCDGEGRCMITKTDAIDGDIDTATWISWEFFDGESIILDTGFDRPIPAVYMEIDYPSGFVDILHVGPPTPSPFWRPMHHSAWPHPCSCCDAEEDESG
jgi:hypothetical protein